MKLHKARISEAPTKTMQMFDESISSQSTNPAY